MENIETRIEQLKAEIEYQGRVVQTSQVGSLTHEIAKLRLEESRNVLETLTAGPA